MVEERSHFYYSICDVDKYKRIPSNAFFNSFEAAEKRAREWLEHIDRVQKNEEENRKFRESNPPVYFK